MVRSWGLFLDESGQFDQADDEVVIAGLLVELGAAGTHHAALRRAIVGCTSGVPWPPRAADLARPVLFALLVRVGRQRAGETGEGPGEAEAAAEALSVRLATLAREDYRAAIRALEEGRRPPRDALLRLDRLARVQAGREWQSVRAIADTARVGLARVFAAALSQRSGGPPRHLFLVGGGETRHEAASPADEGTRRYLDLLELVAVRALDVIARLDGRHTIFAYVLDRGIVHPGLGVPARLHRPVVQEVFARARERVGIPGGRVMLEVVSTPRYDRQVDARLVLADLVANQLRWVMRGDPSLVTLERRLAVRVPWPARSGRPSASHIAAAGTAQERIEAVRRREAPPPWCPGARPWAVEQAEEWVRVLNLS